MTIATDLRAMRAYIAEHGFSPRLGIDGECRCFLGASDSAVGYFIEGSPALLYLQCELDVPTGLHELERDGWTKRDALAALDIAIACAHEEGK